MAGGGAAPTAAAGDGGVAGRQWNGAAAGSGSALVAALRRRVSGDEGPGHPHGDAGRRRRTPPPSLAVNQFLLQQLPVVGGRGGNIFKYSPASAPGCA